MGSRPSRRSRRSASSQSGTVPYHPLPVAVADTVVQALISYTGALADQGLLPPRVEKDPPGESLDPRFRHCQRGPTWVIFVSPVTFGNRQSADCDREKGVPPPGAAVAYRRILKDPRDEPQYAERVPYIVSNAEGRRLIDR